MRVETLNGLSSHPGRNELMQFVSRMNPKPKKIDRSARKQNQKREAV